MVLPSRIIFVAASLLGVSSAQFNSNPAVSESNGAATLSWQIPTGLGSGSTFYTISPTGSTAFFLTSTGVFLALGNYTGRVEFSGSYTSRNITFTLSNISSADAGTYKCGNGDVKPDQVISDCGQMLVVLGKPTKPPRPSPSTTPVYMKQVTLTCTSTSTSLPAGHGRTLTYTWKKDGTIVTPDQGTSFNFTVTSRDPHNYRCKAEESRVLESAWSDVYRMEPEYGPFNETLTPPVNYTVRENQTTIPPISCSANCKPACTYHWEKNGTNFFNSAVLNLGQSSRSQSGSYRCRVVNDHGSVNTSLVIVNVQYPPEVHITTPAGCRPYRVFVGQQNVQLICEVIASNPEVISFTWSHNNSVASSPSGRNLTLNTTSERSSGSYSCQGNNGISGSSVSKSLTLDVQYGPRVSIPAVSPVVEGQNLTVRCTVDANPTAPVSWTKKTDNSFTRTGSVLQFTGIQRYEAGEYVCSATNTISPCGQKAFRQSGEEEVTMDVQYQANISEFSLNSAAGLVTISEGDTVNLKCQVDSNPLATIRLLNGSQELKRGDNSLSETHTWQTTCRQRGNYSCGASNSVGPVAVSDLNLAVNCSPRPDETYPVKYQSASRLGSNVTLWMSVLCYPVPTFTWSRSNSSSQDLSGSLSVLSDISVNISLTLTSLRREEFGLYNLNVSNGVGEHQVTTFEVVPQGPPDLPTNVQVREITPNSALVSWTRGFNGGDTQHFTVSYSTDNTTWINRSKIEEKETTDYYYITLSKLNPSTLYTVRVITGNRFGDSTYTKAVLLETKADRTEPESTALIAGASGGCAALLLLAIGAGGVYMYRRKKGNKDQQDGPSNARSREDLVMQENDLYGRSPGKHNSGLVMEENVCYVSSGEVGGGNGGQAGGATGGVSDVYAAVDKKPKLKDTSAELNTQVKPKKAAKPGKKDKNKKKKSTDDTVPLTKKKQNKRGDVYENTSPGQFMADADANTYANAGFVGDSHTSDETAAVQAPPTGRDADGCLYVGIDFGNQKPGKVIIGDEKSPYADIAFGRVGPPPAPDEDEEKKKKETVSK